MSKRLIIIYLLLFTLMFIILISCSFKSRDEDRTEYWSKKMVGKTFFEIRDYLGSEGIVNCEPGYCKVDMHKATCTKEREIKLKGPYTHSWVGPFTKIHHIDPKGGFVAKHTYELRFVHLLVYFNDGVCTGLKYKQESLYDWSPSRMY